MYHMLYADGDCKLIEHPGLRAAGRTGGYITEILEGDLAELPEGASFVLVPGRAPVGIDRRGRFAVVERDEAAGSGGGPAFAVGALLPQGYTRTLLPAYRRAKGEATLPLFGYTAIAGRGGKVYAAARLTEDPGPWDPALYNSEDLPGLVRQKLDAMPGNRIVRQLSRCALEYGCFTAQNIFYGRREGGVPVSPSCNADCLGCISLQPAGCCPAPQSRIDFRPDPGEVADVAIAHLNGEGAIVSFGQGCEGEPALASATVAGAISRIRSATGLGTINMNTNGGFTAGVAEIAAAGLDAVRVSLISAREETYSAYYRPRGYSLADVRRSIRHCAAAGVYTSLNLLVMPGLTDRAGETEALTGLVRETGVQMVQLRNLNIDPDFLFERLPEPEGELLGIGGLTEALAAVPGLRVGSFSHTIS
ncbi:MAG: radical SAM protein [Eubacteriales bacterium]